MAVSADPKHMYSNPVPGAGLTRMPGSSSWQMPPQFTNEDKALHYLWDNVLQKPQAITQILVFLKSGIAVTEITNTFLFTGVASGKWTLSLALLMYQEVAWMICTIAKVRKVKYKFKRLDPNYAKFLLTYKHFIQEPDVKIEKKTKSLFSGLNSANNTSPMPTLPKGE